ncbi:MAG: HAD family phosphatase [Proteobacteria bacterium]|nr:HAD family phosphatase [Pseudomonadota bacterium]
MIKAIMFDFVGVLGGGVIADFMEIYPEYKAEIKRLFMDEFDLGRGTIAERYEALARAVHADVATVKQQLDKIGEDLYVNDALMNKVLELKKKYKIGLLSNAGLGPIVYDTVRYGSDWRDKYFDDFVLSCDVHLIKPDPEIYKLAAERLGVAASECLFIDDAAKNVAGAENVGMTGILYTDFDQVITDIEKILNKSL